MAITEAQRRANKKYYDSHPETRKERSRLAKKLLREEQPERILEYRRRSAYGLEPADFVALWNSQNGLCAICQEPLKDRGRGGLAIDHDHKTNKVRGILCAKCNFGLGGFRDDPERLAKAIIYLEKAWKP